MKISWGLLVYLCGRTSVVSTNVHGHNLHAFPAPDATNGLIQAQSVNGKGVDDPITSVEIKYPQNGATEKFPVKLSTVINIKPGGAEAFSKLYGNMSTCYKTNGVFSGCIRLDAPSEPELKAHGEVTVQVYLSQTSGDGDPIGKPYWLSTPTTFSVVDDADFDSLREAFEQDKREKYRDGYDLSLVEWAAQQQRQRHEELLRKLGQDEVDDAVDSAVKNDNGTDERGNDLVLLIGVKTAVATNFALRQAIRETWASKDVLPHGAKVLFVGCRPFTSYDDVSDDASDDGDDARGRRLRQAIELEKMVYGDLLTDELDCNDTYLDLASKVKEFLNFAASKYFHAAYVMIADDDIYLRGEELVQYFVDLGPRRQYYSGQVPSIQHARKDKPTREPGKRYSLSMAEYPISQTPPLAMGAYFFLSMDCVRFVSKNRRRLRDLNGMDDITIALWMLTIQVHALHDARLGFLRKDPCNNNFIAFGDLSPLAIREVHSNVLEQRSFCDGFDRNLWLKSSNLAPAGVSRTLPSFLEPLQFSFLVTNARKLGPIEITTVVSTKFIAGVKVLYFASRETFAAHSRQVCAESRLGFPGTVRGMTCADITVQLRGHMQIFYEQVEASGAVEASRLALWRHNLFVKEQEAPPMIIAYSTAASFSSILFEGLFASIQPYRPTVVVDEIDLHDRYEDLADVFVFSILDSDCKYNMANPECRQMVDEYLNRFNHPDSFSGEEKPNGVIMISGERHSVEGLDVRVLLVSTVEGVPRKKHIYLSMASMSFGERLDHDPTSLLVSQGGEYSRNLISSRKFCAYMYARCGRLERELMYDLLNDIEAVDALGKCSGRAHIHTSRGQRPERYNDDAVERYKYYNFVIAFENAQVPGYVTEKLVNAFLAGSVPIYLGNSTTVSQLFNPKSFIDCGSFPSLQQCARYVIQVHKSPELYSAMLREAPITNIEAFKEAFSWHPAVSSNFHAEKIMKYLFSS